MEVDDDDDNNSNKKLLYVRVGHYWVNSENLCPCYRWLERKERMEDEWNTEKGDTGMHVAEEGWGCDNEGRAGS